MDPSSHDYEGHDLGPLNNQIDKHNLDDVPHTYYVTVYQCHRAHIWNVYMLNPWCEILLYEDDINSSFHREHYHPDISTTKSYV